MSSVLRWMRGKRCFNLAESAEANDRVQHKRERTRSLSLTSCDFGGLGGAALVVKQCARRRALQGWFLDLDHICTSIYAQYNLTAYFFFPHRDLDNCQAPPDVDGGRQAQVTARISTTCISIQPSSPERARTLRSWAKICLIKHVLGHC